MKKKGYYPYGIISILFFISVRLLALSSQNILSDLYPTSQIKSIIIIIFTYALSVTGVLLALVGIRGKIQKVGSIFGLILNSLDIILYTLGLLNGYRIL